MELQNGNSATKMEEKTGNVYEVVVDSVSDDELFFVSRSYMDSPDTDGVIYLANNGEDLVGKFVKCKIVGFEDYDLYGEIVKE